MKVWQALLAAQKLMENKLDDGKPDEGKACHVKLDRDALRLECDFILANLLNWERHELYLNKNFELDDNMSNRFFDLINKRLNHMPVQYLTGTREFMGLTFKVDPRVLIPRCDTEILVEYVIDYARNLISKKMNEYGSHGSLEILDIGTGSGAIAVSLAKYIENSRVTATDISSDALEVARENAAENNLLHKMVFINGDLFDPLDNLTFDIIVSNPPYIKREEIGCLMPEVRDYEPIIALDGGDDGLDFYRRIASDAHRHLKPEGLLAVEIGFNQASSVVSLLEDQKKYSSPVILKDLSGHDRVVAVKKYSMQY